MPAYVCPFPTFPIANSKRSSVARTDNVFLREDEEDTGGILDLAAFMAGEDVYQGGDGKGIFFGSTTIKKNFDLPFQARPGRNKRTPPLTPCTSSATNSTARFPCLRRNGFKNALFGRRKDAHRRAVARPDSLIDRANQLAPTRPTAPPRSRASSIRNGSTGTAPSVVFSPKSKPSSQISTATSTMSLSTFSSDLTSAASPSRHCPHGHAAGGGRRSSLTFSSVFPSRRNTRPSPSSSDQSDEDETMDSTAFLRNTEPPSPSRLSASARRKSETKCTCDGSQVRVDVGVEEVRIEEVRIEQARRVSVERVFDVLPRIIGGGGEGLAL
ncbi:hypothetical protein JCM11641_001745 [Rhodosporidiobolus odoratus]